MEQRWKVRVSRWFLLRELSKKRKQKDCLFTFSEDEWLLHRNIQQTTALEVKVS